ncbi:hypothetical protein [Clostridium sp. VAP52]|uniref:hypothetical protein n=1 Tax=Clostridium sp. VAP52 TaxID=2949977 RepID=UPI00207AFEB1|nr:hypothetical protein [Clostridium sp. VAP52]
METKTVIDNNGFIIDLCVNVKNGELENFNLLDNMKLVERYNKGILFVKPKWNGEEWIEGATEQEIKEYEEKNKPKPKELTETEILQKQLLETQNMLLELQYKLTNKDLEIK